MGAMTGSLAARRALALLAALGAMTVHGAEWQVIPRAETGLIADSNYGMATTSAAKRDAIGGLADVRVAFLKLTPISTFEIAPFASYRYYTNLEESGKRGGINTRFEKKGLRSTVGIRADYNIDEILESELRAGGGAEDELGNQDEVELDFVTTRNRRERLQIRPGLRLELSPRTGLEFTGNLSDIDYDRREPGEQEGYASYDVQGGVSFNRTQRSQLGLALQYSEFRPDDAGDAGRGADARTVGLLGRWTNRPSERQQYYFQAGVQRTGYFGSDAADLRDRVLSYGGGVGGRWEWQLATLYLDAVRSIQPNSIGEVVAQSELKGRLTRELRPRLQGVLWARYVDADVLESSEEDGRRLAGAGLDLNWSLTRQTSIVGSYDYAWKKYATGASAGSHAVALSFVYERLRQQ